MRQKATVAEVLPEHKAILRVVRESACSGDCHKCGGCGSVEQSICLTAEDTIGVEKGEIVYVESQSNVVLGAAMLVYLLPLVMFLIAYLIAMPLGKTAFAVGAGAFLLGLLPAFLYDRKLRKKPQVHKIVGRVI